MEARTLDFRKNPLNERDIRRYSRHLILPEIGWGGQNRLKSARVLVVGMGGLGSPAAMYLAAAGVGVIGLADGDTVDESNLHRQIIYGTHDIGRAKTEAARERLLAINPLTEIICHGTRLTRANAMAVITQYDAVIDASDNFPTRYLVNDACIMLKKPCIFGAIHRFEGQASVFGMPDGPCYRCFFSEPPRPQHVRTCAEEGVLGVMPGIIGCIQATETIKVLLGADGILSGRLLLADAWSMRFREVTVRRQKSCPVCGSNPVIRDLIDYDEFCGMKNAGQPAAEQISAHELRSRAAREPLLQIVELRELHETALGDLPRRKIMPLAEVGVRMPEFNPNGPLVFVCKFGIRSETAARVLRDSGYPGKVYSLRDGILGWIREFERPAAAGAL